MHVVADESNDTSGLCYTARFVMCGLDVALISFATNGRQRGYGGLGGQGPLLKTSKHRKHFLQIKVETSSSGLGTSDQILDRCASIGNSWEAERKILGCSRRALGPKEHLNLLGSCA